MVQHDETAADIPARGTPDPKRTERIEDNLSRLRKIEGQVRGLQHQVEGDTDCIDILTQISAVTHALQKVAIGLVDQHLRQCVAGAVTADPKRAEATADDATRVIERLLHI